MSNSHKSHTEIILDSIADGVFTVDSQWRITLFNRAAEKITGIKAREALGRHCWDVLRASICETECSLRKTMETGEQTVNQPVFIVNTKGERVPLSISTAILRDEHGRVVGGVETFRDLTIVEELRKEIQGRHSFLDIISKNPEMHRLFWMLEQVAERDTTVLLLGESGTGKELFAKAIHSLSHRKDAPFVTINCGAIPDTLLESEIFGYKAGAFTDAKRDKPGKVAVANGGTLFLDEIGDISPALQVKLLRLLQEKTYEPLGQTRSSKADVRIVTATNRDLELLVQEGKFRPDLYYRINVVKLVLPPLRERKEDIPLLAQHFVRKFNSLTGKDIRGLSPEALATLMAHSFPGNVRELENIIEYASITCRDQFIRIEHLPDYLKGDQRLEASDVEARGAGSLESLQKAFIIEALMRHNYSRKATAAYLGIHPTTLWRKMKRLGIQPTKARDRQHPMS